MFDQSCYAIEAFETGYKRYTNYKVHGGEMAKKDLFEEIQEEDESFEDKGKLSVEEKLSDEDLEQDID